MPVLGCWIPHPASASWPLSPHPSAYHLRPATETLASPLAPPPPMWGRESDSVGKNIIVRASVADSGSKRIGPLAQETGKRQKKTDLLLVNHPNLHKKLNEDECFRVRVGGFGVRGIPWCPVVEVAPGAACRPAVEAEETAAERRRRRRGRRRSRTPGGLWRRRGKWLKWVSVGP